MDRRVCEIGETEIESANTQTHLGIRSLFSIHTRKPMSNPNAGGEEVLCPVQSPTGITPENGSSF